MKHNTKQPNKPRESWRVTIMVGAGAIKVRYIGTVEGSRETIRATLGNGVKFLEQVCR